MIIGYLYNGRRYSRLQIFSVMLLTFGVVAAALADAKAQGKAISLNTASGAEGAEGKSTVTFIIGFTILALAMLLSSFQGVYADRLYATHGNTHWREALLYSHMLSLPFFLPTYSQLSSQFRAFLSSPSILSDIDHYSAAASALGQGAQHVFMSSNAIQNGTVSLSHMAASLLPSPSSSSMIPAAATITPSPSSLTSSNISGIANQLAQQTTHSIASLFTTGAGAGQVINAILARTPSKIFYLVINALTQYICIRGVYLLAAKSSSLTVTIVLNIRKLVSLLLSIYIFGNSLALGVMIGAAFVFLGGALYGMGSAKAKSQNAIVLQQQEGQQHRNRILEKMSSGYSSIREKNPRHRKVKV